MKKRSRNDAIEARKIREILRRPYSRILTPEPEGGFVAEVLEFPGCFADGETPDEAYRNLESVAEAWIKDALSQGADIPSPVGPDDVSGRFALRMPRTLHYQVTKIAQRERVSINQFIVTTIATKIGAVLAEEKILASLPSIFHMPTVISPIFVSVPAEATSNSMVRPLEVETTAITESLSRFLH